VIDPHVHQNITSSPDAWRTETRSAAIGGVTTLLDFRISDRPFSETFAAERAKAEASSLIDFGFQFIMTTETQLEDLEEAREHGEISREEEDRAQDEIIEARLTPRAARNARPKDG